MRSRSYRKVKVRVPGGRQKIHYRQRRASEARCAKCGQVLHGLPRRRPIRLGGLPKSQLSVNRPYGGNLCSSCMRAEIRNSLFK